MSEIIAIVGPSCSGKDTLRKGLSELGVHDISTYTTRPPRKDETGYIYEAVETWNIMVRQGMFLTTKDYKVASGDIWKYGWTLKSFQDATDCEDPFCTVILPIDVCTRLLTTDYIRHVVLLRCDPFTALYRYLDRNAKMNDGADPTLLSEKEIFRRIGKDSFDFRDENIEKLKTQALHNFVSVVTFITDEYAPNPEYILSLLTHRSKLNDIVGIHPRKEET